jgi:UPF0176 protein
MDDQIQIITFYEFLDLERLRPIEESKQLVREAMMETTVRGTVILAREGFNSSVCGSRESIASFVGIFERIFETKLVYKSSFHAEAPFRKIDVKIRPEIVTLRRDVDVSLARGTHVSAAEWNELLASDDVVVLDTRNDYEFRNGTFRGALNPKTTKFSELPDFVEANAEKFAGKKVAMFCTGGIRCEKFAPYMIAKGFGEVFQLEGGILKYLEEVDPAESLWEGECFVFDERRTVDETLKKGVQPDYSLRHKSGSGS